MMQTYQAHFRGTMVLDSEVARLKAINPQLVLFFGSHANFSRIGLAAKVAKNFPDALTIGCSTAGEITNKGIFDDSLVVTAVRFNRAKLKPVSAEIAAMAESRACGRRLAEQLNKDDLSAVIVLGRGTEIDGSALIEGIKEVLGPKVLLTGGLAGDGGQFKQTFTLLNGEISDSRVVGFGLYGDGVKISYGSMGGWKPYGEFKAVTKAEANVLFEVDGQPALEFYRALLGPARAKELPAVGLYYPFEVFKTKGDSAGIIRTILGIDENRKALILAGDIEKAGSWVRLMHTNSTSLSEGARMAANQARDVGGQRIGSGIGILVSCVGRKLVMANNINDELRAVRDVLGASPVTGFYSYGEICPDTGFGECRLHNQTMTITYLYE